MTGDSGGRKARRLKAHLYEQTAPVIAVEEPDSGAIELADAPHDGEPEPSAGRGLPSRTVESFEYPFLFLLWDTGTGVRHPKKDELPPGFDHDPNPTSTRGVFDRVINQVTDQYAQYRRVHGDHAGIAVGDGLHHLNGLSARRRLLVLHHLGDCLAQRPGPARSPTLQVPGGQASTTGRRGVSRGRPLE